MDLIILVEASSMRANVNPCAGACAGVAIVLVGITFGAKTSCFEQKRKNKILHRRLFS